MIEIRQRLRIEYGDLHDKIQALLFRHDPIGINFETNTDEYDPEVRTILPRLKSCHSVGAVRRMVHEEFVDWFGAEIAGEQEHYTQIGREIWELWQQFTNAGG